MKILPPPARAALCRLSNLARRLHRDERGAEGLEKLLIVAAVVLPLLGVLVFFRNEISVWVNDKWGTVRNAGEADPFSGNPGSGTP